MVDNVKIGNLYAVHHGDYAGQMFALINFNEKSYNFLAMPDMKNIQVPVNDFDKGIEKIIKFVETLPKDVFKVIKAQYKKNETTND